MAAKVARWLPKWPPIDKRVISLSSKCQPHSSKMAKNGSKMAAKMAADRYKIN